MCQTSGVAHPSSDSDTATVTDVPVPRSFVASPRARNRGAGRDDVIPT